MKTDKTFEIVKKKKKSGFSKFYENVKLFCFGTNMGKNIRTKMYMKNQMTKQKKNSEFSDISVNSIAPVIGYDNESQNSYS